MSPEAETRLREENKRLKAEHDALLEALKETIANLSDVSALGQRLKRRAESHLDRLDGHTS